MALENRVVSEEEYKLKPFSHLKCKDPYYDDESAKWTIDESLYSGSTRQAGIVLQKVEFADDETDIRFEMLKVIAYNIAKGDYARELVDTHKDGHYAPSVLKKQVDLACDSASFDLTVDDRAIHMNTGADGFYGTYFHYTHNRACVLELMLDSDVVSLDRLRQDMGYVFKSKEMFKEVGIDNKKKSNVERD